MTGNIHSGVAPILVCYETSEHSSRVGQPKPEGKKGCVSKTSKKNFPINYITEGDIYKKTINKNKKHRNEAKNCCEKSAEIIILNENYKSAEKSLCETLEKSKLRKSSQKMEQKRGKKKVKKEDKCGAQNKEKRYIPEFIRRQNDNHAHIRVACCECGYEYMIDAKCSDRTCELCNYRRKKELLARYRNVVVKSELNYFLTLTVKRIELTGENTAWFKGCIKKLRRRKIFRGVSGMMNIEVGTVKLEGDRVTANYHMHAPIDGRIDVVELRRVWEDITGSNWIKIEPCRDGRGALHYLSKHAFKIGAINDENPEVVSRLSRRINRALRGVRLLEGFGSLEGIEGCWDESFCPCCSANNSFVSQFDALYVDVIALSPASAIEVKGCIGASGGA